MAKHFHVLIHMFALGITMAAVFNQGVNVGLNMIASINQHNK